MNGLLWWHLQFWILNYTTSTRTGNKYGTWKSTFDKETILQRGFHVTFPWVYIYNSNFDGWHTMMKWNKSSVLLNIEKLSMLILSPIRWWIATFHISPPTSTRELTSLVTSARTNSAFCGKEMVVILAKRCGCDIQFLGRVWQRIMRLVDAKGLTNALGHA